MITFAEIKTAYPQPTKPGSGVCGYCVGGAFCLAVGHPHTERFMFPDEHVLSDELEKVLLLSEEAATQASASIISLNDMGNFEGAWAALHTCFKG